MVDRFKLFLAPPAFANEEDNRIAGILNAILLTLLTATIMMTLVMALFGNGMTGFALFLTSLFMLGCFGLMRRGYLRIAGIGVLLVLILVVVFILFDGAGVHDLAILLLPIIIIIAGLVFDSKLFAMITGLTVLSVGLVILLEEEGLVERAVYTRDSKTLEFVILATILVITAVTVHLLVKSLKDNLSRARKSESQWRSLVKNAPDFIYNLQPDGTIDFLNRLTNPDDTSVIGHTIYEFTHPDFHDQIRNALNHVVTTGKPARYESLVRRQSGEYGWYANRLGVVNLQGSITGLTMISIDISKRRAMEIALESEREFAQHIIDNMGQGLTITDENGRFVYVNPAYTRMTGYRVDVLVGKTPYELVTPEAFAELEKQALARQTGETGSYASQIQHADGHTVHVLITGVPRWQDGKYIGSIAVITDLTEQMEAEMERERLIAELEARNVELERFTYTVSHDLKSPLITIRGFLGVLAQDLEQENEAGVQTAVQYIDRAAGTMETLLRDLLELSRIGRVINAPEATPFASIVEEALLRVSGQIDAHNVQIEVADDLPVVLVDRTRLVEALQNLLDNAIKFSQDQTQTLIKVGSVQKNEETRFFVQDNGIGIAPKYQKKVFDLFERLDNSTEGTGIGLAVVKRIIEVHNGRLWVESAGVGQGATFYFTLPLAVDD